MRTWMMQLSLLFRRPHRQAGQLRKFVPFRPTLEALEERRVLSNYTVSNTLTSGAGSFAQAILNANAHPGYDEIDFSIGTGAVKIEPTTALPAITDPVYINGTSQPGFSRDPLIELDGAHTPFGTSGLDITGGGSTVRGLAINNFGSENGILLEDEGGNLIAGNVIGASPGGTVAKPNSDGILIMSSDNTIGGLTVADRNIISGNSNGLVVDGAAATGNLIEGDYIGTDKSGTRALANGDGVIIFNSAANNTVGGLTAPARNVISGNFASGVLLFYGASGNTVEGNYIGTDKEGATALPNSSTYHGQFEDAGISIQGSSGNVIGGTTSGARNIISGNESSGIVVTVTFGAMNSLIPSTGNLIEGNYIGTDKTGTVAVGNADWGVTAGEGQNTVGGTVSGAGNLISGNELGGVSLYGGIDLEGNYIGTDKTGTAALGNAGPGVIVYGSANTVGGTGSDARNVISGNSGAGVVLMGFSGDIPTVPEDNLIQHNYIGVAKNGVTPMGNGADGVSLTNSDHNTILSNTIADNSGDGVDILSGTQNRIRYNSIFGNGGLGIDLGGDGVTANDNLDADTGPNELQNYPTFTAQNIDGVTVVSGLLSSAPNQVYSLQFFFSVATDPSGYGEGKTYAGTTISVTTNSSGVASFSLGLGVLVPKGDFVTATATDSVGNSSEFSLAAVVP